MTEKELWEVDESAVNPDSSAEFQSVVDSVRIILARVQMHQDRTEELFLEDVSKNCQEVAKNLLINLKSLWHFHEAVGVAVSRKPTK